MQDDRILRAFGELDQPVAPDPEFARVLYERLVVDLGFRARPGFMARVLGAVGVHPRSARRAGEAPRLRLVFAGIAAVVVLAGGTLFAAANLSQVSPPIQPAPSMPPVTPAPSTGAQGDAAAAELVRQSQAAQADPPAVRYELQVSGYPVTLPNGKEAETWTATVSSDGKGTWRTEGPEDRAGGYMLYDGRRYAIYDGVTRSWDVQPVENGGPPFPMNDAFAWTEVSYPGEVATLTTLDCADATSRGEVVIAGRTADRVSCPTLKLEYALDRATHLVLRLAADPGSATADAGTPVVKEVTSFEEITPDATAFDWAGPTVAVRSPGPIEGTSLVVGERPPQWSGATITGKAFSTKGLSGPSAILFLCLDCTSGPDAYARFTTAAAAHPGVRAVIVGQGAEVGTLAGYVKEHPTDATVISDVNSDFPTAWGYRYLGGLVMLGRGGTVGDLLSARISADDYERIFSAAEQGLPIPVPAGLDSGSATSPSAAPASPWPSPGASAATEPLCGGDLVVCHNPGWQAPAWTGSMPDGATFDSTTLAGKPAIVWFGDIQSRSSLAALASIGERYAGRAGVVAITSREVTPGETAALLQAMKVQLPVVLDWGGTIGQAFKTLTLGAVLLDADGRLVAQSTGVEDLKFLRELDRLVAGS